MAGLVALAAWRGDGEPDVTGESSAGPGE